MYRQELWLVAFATIGKWCEYVHHTDKVKAAIKKTNASMRPCRFFTPKFFDDVEPPQLIDDDSADDRLQSGSKELARLTEPVGLLTGPAMIRPAMVYLSTRQLTFSQQDIDKSVADETTPPYQPRNKKHVPHRTDEDGNVTFDDQDTIETKEA